MSQLCIYHGGCVDGFTAAWIVAKRFPQADLVAAGYGDPAPDCTDDDVYIVDFSYPRAELWALCERAESVTVFDHHQTAQADLEGFDHPRARVVFDMDRSGAGITWDELHLDEQRLDLVDYVEDRDLWRLKLKGNAEVYAVLQSHPKTLEVWDTLANTGLADLWAEGAGINRYRQQLIDSAVKEAFEMTIGGHAVMVANCVYAVASEVAGRLSEGRPFGAYYYDAPGERRWGLRSTVEGLDVSEIAQQYGGGGHKHAAGFRHAGRTHPNITDMDAL